MVFFIGNWNHFDFVALSKMCMCVSVSVSLLVTKRNSHAKTKWKSWFAGKAPVWTAVGVQSLSDRFQQASGVLLPAAVVI